MLVIKNYTPHTINLYKNSDCTEVQQGAYTSLVLNEGAQPLQTFKSEGVARATSSKKEVDLLEIDGQTVAVNATVFGEIQGLPEPVEGTYFIVSALAAQAAPDRHDLLIVDGTVRDSAGRICGCTAFGRV